MALNLSVASIWASDTFIRPARFRYAPYNYEVVIVFNTATLYTSPIVKIGRFCKNRKSAANLVFDLNKANKCDLPNKEKMMTIFGILKPCEEELDLLIPTKTQELPTSMYIEQIKHHKY